MLCFIRVEVDKDYKDQTEQAIDLATDYCMDQGYEVEHFTLAVLNLKSGVLECISDPSMWGGNRRKALPNWSTPDKLSAWLQSVIPTPEQCDREIGQALTNLRALDKRWQAAKRKPVLGNMFYTESQKIYALEMFKKSYQGPMDITDPHNEYCAMGFEESFVTNHMEVYVATDHLNKKSKPTHVVILEISTDVSRG